MYSNRGKPPLETLENENVLQAVIIVDTFTQNMSPFCDYMPSSLLPLANRPILDYTLECLFSAGIQEVILFCPSYADQIRNFISADKWPGLTINVVVLEGCRTLGDVMRDLDTKALIRSDFILLSGNLVGNLQLLPALEKHVRTQKLDKGAVMTLIFKESGKRWRAPEDNFTVALDSKTNRVLLYNKKMKNPGKINIPMELVLETTQMDLRCDLQDSQVSICSVAVPPLFSDNFDFQTRDDFLRGLLVQDEVLTSTIYAYILPPGQYAATVNSWAHYQHVTHDVIHRWIYPLVPDMFSDEPYIFKRNNIYTQRNVTLSQGSKLEEDVVIASGSSVGQNTTVTHSVIGKNCHIGSNVVLEGAYIMDNTIIKDGCHVLYSVIGPNCTLHTQVKVTDGSVLAVGVVIDANKHISGLKLQSQPPESSDQREPLCSKAYVFRSISEDDSDSDSETNEVITGLRINKDEADDDWEDSSESDGDVDHSLSPVPEDTNLFYNEVVDSLVRGYEDKLLCENLMLEINSSRYAYNVTMNEVTVNVVRAILTLPKPSENAWKHLESHLKYFTPILTNYVRSESAQQDCLFGIEDIAESHPDILQISVKIIHWLYEHDILSEEAILTWYSKLPSSDARDQPVLSIREKVSSLISWLKEADEEQSDDEDD